MAEREAVNEVKKDPRKQLAKLDARLGKGVGAKKERARLQKEIEDGESSKQG